MAIQALFDAAPSGKIDLTRRHTGRRYACTGCGTPVYRKRSKAERIDAGLLEPWCSRGCISKHKRYRGTCANCQKEFSTPQSHLKRNGRGVYCSRKCKDSHRRIKVRCAWPCCSETMEARAFNLVRRGKPVVEYKTNLIKKGTTRQYPVCAKHLKIAGRHLGDDFRLSGIVKWFADPDRCLGSRATNSRIARLFIFYKSDGHCCGCGVQRQFDKTDDWHIDHTEPVYKGGKTNFHNLQLLCIDCHDRKTAVEKSDVALLRHTQQALGRWLTHSQKDALISDLRAEIDGLRAQLRKLSTGGRNADQKSILG